MKLSNVILAWSEEKIPFLETLTTGAGIFLGCMVIAFVLLYGQTKERWNWAAPLMLLSAGCRAVMRLVGSTLDGLRGGCMALCRRIGSIKRRSWRMLGCVIAGLAVLGAAGFAVRTHHQRVVMKGRYIEFAELHLGMSEDDVKVLKGAPSQIHDLISVASVVDQQEIKRWSYNRLDDLWDGVACHLYFRDGRLIAMERLLPAPPGRTLNDYRKEYGIAQVQKTNRNGLSRWYFVKDKGLYYNVVGGKIERDGNFRLNDVETFAELIVRDEEEWGDDPKVPAQNLNEWGDRIEEPAGKAKLESNRAVFDPSLPYEVVDPSLIKPDSGGSGFDPDKFLQKR